MTKTKKIFTVLSCLMLLVIMSVSIFMVGCEGEDATTLTTTLSASVQNFNVGDTKQSVADWGVAYTPGYEIEFDVLDAEGNKEKYGPNLDKTSLTLTTYEDLLKYGFSVTGFDTSTPTAENETRICTITYINKQASFKYTVGAAA
jgi:hypothetical protein